MMKTTAALALMIATTSASLASPQITSVKCECKDRNIATTIEFRDDTGAYRQRGAITPTSSGFTSSSTLFDGAGRTLATARTSTGSKPQITRGPGFTAAIEASLEEVLFDDLVQKVLEECATKFPGQPDPFPWQSFCPVLVYVWDEDLVRELCEWVPPPLIP
jgi:hypothetical protein